MGRQWAGGTGPRIQPGAPWPTPPTRLTGLLLYRVSPERTLKVGRGGEQLVNVPSQSSADGSILRRFWGTCGESREVTDLGWLLLQGREGQRGITMWHQLGP